MVIMDHILLGKFNPRIFELWIILFSGKSKSPSIHKKNEKITKFRKSKNNNMFSFVGPIFQNPNRHPDGCFLQQGAAIGTNK